MTNLIKTAKNELIFRYINSFHSTMTISDLNKKNLDKIINLKAIWYGMRNIWNANYFKHSFLKSYQKVNVSFKISFIHN